jgi:large subunit ribosomal protein L25
MGRAGFSKMLGLKNQRGDQSMAATNELNARARKSAGKGAARAIRREGRVPGVIYGGKKDPETISLDYVDVLKAVNTGQFLSTIYSVNIEDGKKTRVIPRDVQFDPIKDFPLHVDFLRVSKDARLIVEITVNFIGEENSPGMKRGGNLNIVRHEIEISSPADSIPDSIEADISELDIGDTLHSSALKLPEGVELTITDRDFTIASISGQVSEEAETDVGEEAAIAPEGAGEGEGSGDSED